MRLLPAAVLGAALTLFSSSDTEAAEKAAPRTSALSWVRLPGAESCVAARELSLAVEQELGRPVFVPPSTAGVTVEGHIEPRAESIGFRALLQLVGEGGVLLGSRELMGDDPSCEALTDSLVLAAALMIDPDAFEPAAAAPAPPAVAPVAPSPTLLVLPGPLVERTEMAVTPSPWRFQVDAGPTVAAGLLEDVTPGMQLRMLLDPLGFPGIELSGAFYPPHGDGRRFVLLVAALGVCPLITDTVAARLSACIGMAGGGIRQTVFTWELAGHPYVELGAHRRLIGPLLVTLGVGVAVPLHPPRFNHGPVAGTLDLGLGVELP